LLQAIGATAGIGETAEHYIEIAVACATQPDFLAGYRTLFTEANWAATIGDIATFTHHYEASLTQIERALRNQYPEPVENIVPDPVLAVAASIQVQHV
jgi:hypothetical protein